MSEVKGPGLKPTLTGVEDPADHAGEHHEEHGQELQVATQDTARLHVGQVLGREAALDNHLDRRGEGGGGEAMHDRTDKCTVIQSAFGLIVLLLSRDQRV